MPPGLAIFECSLEAFSQIPSGETSGKSVKPKVYLALGIIGAFEPVAGISGAGTVIAVDEDKKTPIFQVADSKFPEEKLSFCHNNT